MTPEQQEEQRRSFAFENVSMHNPDVTRDVVDRAAEQLRLIKIVDEHGDFVTLDDGFVYYGPDSGGGLSAHMLRTIADELDRRNADWSKQIDLYFENERKRNNG